MIVMVGTRGSPHFAWRHVVVDRKRRPGSRVHFRNSVIRASPGVREEALAIGRRMRAEMAKKHPEAMNLHIFTISDEDARKAVDENGKPLFTVDGLLPEEVRG